MIDVVFSDSEKVALELANESNKENHLEISSKSSVVSLGFFLDLGDISNEIDNFKRKAALKELWVGLDYTEEDMNKYIKMKNDEINTLMAFANSGVEIRVWISDTPNSICGFTYLCYLLRDMECKITEIKLPRFYERDKNSLVSYSHWGEVDPKEIYKLLSVKRRVSNIEKQYQSNLWKRLMKENSPIRAIVNGELVSVPENFYDHIIVRDLPRDEFRVVELIGKLIGEYRLGLSDSFYAIRINKLIEERYLEVISIAEINNPYSMTLKKL